MSEEKGREPTVSEVLGDIGNHTVQQVLRAVAAAETPEGQELGAISLLGSHQHGEPAAAVFLVGDPDLIRHVQKAIDEFEEELDVEEEAGDWVEGLRHERD